MRGLVRRAGLTMLDQGLSSVSNLLITVVAARTLDAPDFGAFGIALTIYIVVAGICRSMFGEPLLTRHRLYSSSRPPGRAVTGGGLLIGLAALPPLMACALALRGTLGASVAILALVLPCVLMQDALRFHAIAHDRQIRAVVNDGLWLGLLALVLLIYVATTSVISAPLLVLLWGTSGFVAYVMMTCSVDRFLPSLPAAGEWCRRHSDLSLRYSIEFMAAGGAGYAAIFALGAISGVTSVGSMRAVQSLFGPIFVVYSGSYLVLVPEGTRWLHRHRRLLVVMVSGSAAIVLAAAMWIALGLLVPTRLGEAAFGSSWAGARRVLLPYGLSLCAAGLGAGAVAGLRSLSAARDGLRARLLSLPFVISAPIAGALIDDEIGFSYGLVVGAAATSALYWTQLMRSSKRTIPSAVAAEHGGTP